MLFLVLSLLVVSALAAPSAPLYPGVGAIYKGPDSETIIKGPDGSRITSHAEGAALELKEEELKPIVGPAPHAVPHIPKKKEEGEKKPKVEIKGPSGKVETHGEHAKVTGPAGGHKKSGTEEVVEVAEKAVKAVPKSDAVIFALEEPEGYYGGYPNGGEWGGEDDGEDEYYEKDGEGEEGEEGEEEYDPFVIKAY